MTDCVVEIELTVPSAAGPDVPAVGYIQFAPSKRRDLEGSIVLPDAFSVRLDDEGKATVELAPTVEGDWAWRATERIRRGRRWYFAVPDGPGPVEYDDLVEVDPTTLDPTAPLAPVWKQYIDDLVAELQEQIDAVEAGDVDSVAGLAGTVTAAALKTAINLPADTVAELAENAQDITDEVFRAQGIEGGLRTDLDDHAGDTSNPHSVTKAQVGLGEADDTADMDKPISTATLAALEDKADLVDGVVPTSQIPAIALGTGQAVANRAAMLALTNVQPGDFVSITATADKGTYILNDPDPTVFGHWLALSVPTDVVQSVNGQNGVVVLAKGDVGLGSVDNTSDADKPVSTATSTALGTKVPTARTVNGHALSADVTVSKGDVGLGNVDNTSDANKPVSLALAQLVQWARNPDQLIAGTIVRDANDAITSAPVVWPDGTPGTFTADTLSTDFPGAVDAYHVTYGSPATKTFTQNAVTRNANGAVTALPAIVVS